MTGQTLNRFEWLKALNRSGLLPRAKVVASALAIEFCNDETGRLDPSLTTLADATGKTVDTVKRAIRDLVEGGWLARTEGRGRGNKTEYTLLSPGKIIAISNPKKGAQVHHIKGGTGAPLTKEKGAQVHGKGGTGALSYNKDKQTMNKYSANPDRWAAHRFIGNAWDGPSLVLASDYDTLSAWGRWLKSHGLPALDRLQLQTFGRDGTKVFRLPYRTPPSDAQREAEALAYFAEKVEEQGVSYAAQ